MPIVAVCLLAAISEKAGKMTGISSFIPITGGIGSDRKDDLLTSLNTQNVFVFIGNGSLDINVLDFIIGYINIKVSNIIYAAEYF